MRLLTVWMLQIYVTLCMLVELNLSEILFRPCSFYTGLRYRMYVIYIWGGSRLTVQ